MYIESLASVLSIIALRDHFNLKLKKEAEKYKQKVINEVKEGKRGNSYAALRKLDNGFEGKKYTEFTLPSHVDQSLDPKQSAEELAEYFSLISQEFEKNII